MEFASTSGRYLRKVNIATRNNLFVSMATCFGGKLYVPLFRSVTTGELPRAPFFGFVGPVKEINEGQLLVGFESYFDTMLSNLDVDSAILKMTKWSENTDGFSFASCKDVFDYVISSFINDYIPSVINGTNENIEKTVQLFIENTKVVPSQKSVDYVREYSQSKDFFRQMIVDMEKSFFMLDIYPENIGRLTKDLMWPSKLDALFDGMKQS